MEMKKIMFTLASTAILTVLVAEPVFNNAQTVSAAKHHKKKQTKKKTANKKTSKQKTNKQSKQANSNSNQTNSTNNNTNAFASNNSSGDWTTVKPQSDYSSLADWYADNGGHLFNKYHSGSDADSIAYQSGYHDGGELRINPSNYTNEIYKEGWMSGFLYDEADPNSGSAPLGGKSISGEYSRAIDTFNAGVALIQQKNNSHYIYIDLNNQWQEADY